MKTSPSTIDSIVSICFSNISQMRVMLKLHQWLDAAGKSAVTGAKTNPSALLRVWLANEVLVLGKSFRKNKFHGTLKCGWFFSLYIGSD